jgi:hypothetical protein
MMSEAIKKFVSEAIPYLVAAFVGLSGYNGWNDWVAKHKLRSYGATQTADQVSERRAFESNLTNILVVLAQNNNTTALTLSNLANIDTKKLVAEVISQISGQSNNLAQTSTKGSGKNNQPEPPLTQTPNTNEQQPGSEQPSGVVGMSTSSVELQIADGLALKHSPLLFYRRAYGVAGAKLYQTRAFVNFDSCPKIKELVEAVDYQLGDNGNVSFIGYSEMSITTINTAFKLTAALKLRQPVSYKGNKSTTITLEDTIDPYAQ